METLLGPFKLWHIFQGLPQEILGKWISITCQIKRVLSWMTWTFLTVAQLPCSWLPRGYSEGPVLHDLEHVLFQDSKTGSCNVSVTAGKRVLPLRKGSWELVIINTDPKIWGTIRLLIHQQPIINSKQKSEDTDICFAYQFIWNYELNWDFPFVPR